MQHKAKSSCDIEKNEETNKKQTKTCWMRRDTLVFSGCFGFLFLFFCFFHFRPHSGVNVRSLDETGCCIALTFFLFYNVFSRHLSGRLWWHVKWTYQSQALCTHTMDATQHMDGLGGILCTAHHNLYNLTLGGMPWLFNSNNQGTIDGVTKCIRTDAEVPRWIEAKIMTSKSNTFWSNSGNRWRTKLEELSMCSCHSREEVLYNELNFIR